MNTLVAALAMAFLQIVWMGSTLPRFDRVPDIGVWRYGLCAVWIGVFVLSAFVALESCASQVVDAAVCLE